jgi:hypothetical protein
VSPASNGDGGGEVERESEGAPRVAQARRKAAKSGESLTTGARGGGSDAEGVDATRDPVLEEPSGEVDGDVEREAAGEPRVAPAGRKAAKRGAPVTTGARRGGSDAEGVDATREPVLEEPSGEVDGEVEREAAGEPRVAPARPKPSKSGESLTTRG